MTLPLMDKQYLTDRQINHEVVSDGGMMCVIFPGWRLPTGLSLGEVDVLLRLAPGYPDIAPDMWWVCPKLLRSNGSVIPATEVHEIYLGRTWQRWSRHFQAGQWQAGTDGLESYLALVQAEFCAAAGRVA